MSLQQQDGENPLPLRAFDVITNYVNKMDSGQPLSHDFDEQRPSATSSNTARTEYHGSLVGERKDILLAREAALLIYLLNFGHFCCSGLAKSSANGDGSTSS
ncbi:hypothetical protein HAX54_021520 [Datura stramonium]|uniref:Uncharacterized protein n=1 Tax=Datura stramonium TaxID=4076 RepID=A0ABS8UT20_DATST|nr:hypothetical protein [Datura stramonium]